MRPEVIKNAKYVSKLPDVENPELWKHSNFRDRIVYIHPEHEPVWLPKKPSEEYGE